MYLRLGSCLSRLKLELERAAPAGLLESCLQEKVFPRVLEKSSEREEQGCGICIMWVTLQIQCRLKNMFYSLHHI